MHTRARTQPHIRTRVHAHTRTRPYARAHAHAHTHSLKRARIHTDIPVSWPTSDHTERTAWYTLLPDDKARGQIELTLRWKEDALAALAAEAEDEGEGVAAFAAAAAAAAEGCSVFGIGSRSVNVRLGRVLCWYDRRHAAIGSCQTRTSMLSGPRYYHRQLPNQGPSTLYGPRCYQQHCRQWY